MMQDQTNFGLKMQREKTRQEEMVKSLQERKRQKTFVEKKTKEERERQIEKIRERRDRIKYERTMTMKEPKALPVDGQEPQDFTKGKGEEMEAKAKELEEKFRQEQEKMAQGG